MAADFDTLVEELIAIEGGSQIVDDPNDRGGLTKYGISQKAYPDVDIANLTKEEAISIYKRDYWDKMQLEQVPEEYRKHLFFSGVVSGTNSVVRDLQRAVGATVDGRMGPNTRAALENFSGNLEREMVVAQANRYVAIAERDPSQRQFLNGWMNRTLGTQFSERGEDVRNLSPDELRSRIQEVADVKYPSAQQRPNVAMQDPQPQALSYDPMGFLDTLMLLMEQRINSPSRPSQALSEPSTAAPVDGDQEVRVPQFNEAEEQMIDRLVEAKKKQQERPVFNGAEEEMIGKLVDGLKNREKRAGPVFVEERSEADDQARLIQQIF